MNEQKSIENQIDNAAEAVNVQSTELEELSASTEGGQPLGFDNLMGVPVNVTVQIGQTRMPLCDLARLSPGSLIPLDREAHEPADIMVNGKIVARGEVVTIDNNYGVRVTSVQNLN